MTDLKTIFVSEEMLGDLALENADLATDDGLRTAVLLSLFSDARAKADDPLPGDPEDRRGWWGDAFPPAVDGAGLEGDRFGSRLWLLKREKIVPSVLARAKTYAEDSLAWLVQARIASGVIVVAEAQPGNRLALSVSIQRTGVAGIERRSGEMWEASYAL